MHHWTLLALYALCFACIAGNAWQARRVGTVRTVGLVVCGAWAAQQIYWWHYQSDSIVFFAICDAAIIGTVWRGGREWTAKAIVALLPIGWACTGLQALHGPSPGPWWVSWAVVALQMVLGLPWPKLQRITPEVSHGSLRAGEISMKDTAYAGFWGNDDPVVYRGVRHGLGSVLCATVSPPESPARKGGKADGRDREVEREGTGGVAPKVHAMTLFGKHSFRQRMACLERRIHAMMGHK